MDCNRVPWWRRGRINIPLIFAWIGAVALALGAGVEFRLSAQQVVTPGERKWEVLEGCRLIQTEARDGDSFHVVHGNREYIFRLYFVDAPEISGGFRDRISDQAAYFGVAMDAIPELGRAAAGFSAERLKDGCTAVTRWQNARGQSALARYYAIVLVGGKNLAAELVANGHARIHGLRANWPDGSRAAHFVNELKHLELAARADQRGAWHARYRSAAAPPPPPAPGGLVDLNDATLEQLTELRGIGPVLAGRIIAHRPYETPEDILRVRGIGPKLLDQLRDRITVRSSPPAKSPPA